VNKRPTPNKKSKRQQDIDMVSFGLAWAVRIIIVFAVLELLGIDTSVIRGAW
jgi:hypothetical protein